MKVMEFFQRPRTGGKGPLRLHIGSGQQAFQGWINIDNQPLPGVDRVLDVRKGLPYRDATAIYAEHFLEHIGFDDALAFLRECRRALAEFGVLRISTPNLDWVYKTHYPSVDTGSPVERLRDCFQLNQAFHGWGHQFLYNKPSLEAALKASGFERVRFHRYGESDVPELSGMERHRTWEDTADLPHVIIAEASGRAAPRPLPGKELEEYREAIQTR